MQVAESDLEIAREVLGEDRSADLASIPGTETPVAEDGVRPETREAELRVYEPRTYFRAILAVIAGLAVLYYVWLQIHSE